MFHHPLAQQHCAVPSGPFRVMAEAPRAPRGEPAQAPKHGELARRTSSDPFHPIAAACFQPDHGEFHAVLVMPVSKARDELARGLWSAGMLVTVFSSLKEAEGILVSQQAHVVLVDVGLGIHTGPKAARWLRAVGRGATRVVVLGETSVEEREELVRNGVAQCLPLPSSASAFARRLGESLGFRLATWHP